MSESLHRIAVTVSRGDLSKANFTESTHMLSFSDVEITEEEAILLKEAIINIICSIRHMRTGKEVMGVYKTENPATDPRH